MKSKIVQLLETIKVVWMPIGDEYSGVYSGLGIVHMWFRAVMIVPPITLIQWIIVSIEMTVLQYRVSAGYNASKKR